MKMKRLFISLLVLILAFSLVLVSCEREEEPETSQSTEETEKPFGAEEYESCAAEFADNMDGVKVTYTSVISGIDESKNVEFEAYIEKGEEKYTVKTSLGEEKAFYTPGKELCAFASYLSPLEKATNIKEKGNGLEVDEELDPDDYRQFILTSSIMYSGYEKELKKKVGLSDIKYHAEIENDTLISYCYTYRITIHDDEDYTIDVKTVITREKKDS